MRRDDRGAATAELAVALPALVIVLAVCVGAVSASARTVALQDRAADAARLVARGDDPARALAGERSPARIEIAERDDLVCVTLGDSLRIAGLLPIDTAGTGCALAGGD